VALYFGLPFIAWCYFVYYITRKSRERRLSVAPLAQPSDAF
jgi:S-methylmethionine transporter